MNTRRPTDAAGETWRKWGNDRPPPDALHEPEAPVRREERLDPGAGCALLMAFAAGIVTALVGVALFSAVTASAVSAAPRPAPVIPAVRAMETAGSEPDQGRTGAPRVRGGVDPRKGNHVAASAVGPSAEASVASLPRPLGAPLAGDATWCAPTPKNCQSWGGDAHLGAMRSFRYGDRPYQVVVQFGRQATTVLVVSYCACPATLIDLSPAAFDDLAPLTRGRIPVTVTASHGPGATPPATDVVP